MTTMTREDVSYLKRASEGYGGDVYAMNVDGKNILRAVKRADPNDAFSEDKRVDIPVDGNGAHGFFTGGYDFPWHTLRTGDAVRLEWFPDAYTYDALRDAGLHVDALYVHVTRGKTTARYLAATGCAPESSARMCTSNPGTSFG